MSYIKEKDLSEHDCLSAEKVEPTDGYFTNNMKVIPYLLTCPQRPNTGVRPPKEMPQKGHLTNDLITT